MKTFEFKLYRHKRCKKLHQTVAASASIYNHCIALHKRYYRMYGKHLNSNKLKGHIAKKRRTNPFWQLVGSQAVQEGLIGPISCFLSITLKAFGHPTSKNGRSTSLSP